MPLISRLIMQLSNPCLEIRGLWVSDWLDPLTGERLNFGVTVILAVIMFGDHLAALSMTPDVIHFVAAALAAAAAAAASFFASHQGFLGGPPSVGPSAC